MSTAATPGEDKQARGVAGGASARVARRVRWVLRASGLMAAMVAGCTVNGRVGQLDGASGAGGAEDGGGSSGAGAGGAAGQAGRAGVAGAAGMPPKTPGWLAGQPLFTWIPIAGTEGVAGAHVDAYSGMAVRGDTGEIWVAAAGGGHDGHDNRVVMLRLTDDAPTWALRRAPSTQTAPDVSHYPDGAPASREVYHAIHWSPVARRVLLTGVRYTHPTNGIFPDVDGFDPETNQWDTAGTWAPMPDTAYGFGMVQDGAGRIWTNGLARFDPATNGWTAPLDLRPVPTRFPASYDGLRDEIFTLMVGDGQGYDGTAVNASRVALGQGEPLVQEAIALEAGAGLDALNEKAPTYAAMAHNPATGDHYFYEGQHAPGRVIAVSPRSSGSWPARVLELSTSQGVPPACPDSGVQSRFQYVAALKGFVLLPRASSGLWFFRVE